MAARTYSLFVKEGTSWTRVSSQAYPLQQARDRFQSRLLNGVEHGKTMELRPAAVADPETSTHYVREWARAVWDKPIAV